MRLTTARYYTPSGRSIQAKGIEPDIEVIQELPEELKGKLDTASEASLRGHLLSDAERQALEAKQKADEAAKPSADTTPAQEEQKKEDAAAVAYVPPDPKDDKQLNYAMDLLRGIQVNARFPATAAQGIPN
jgi:carboxyl-terminal processing protease